MKVGTQACFVINYTQVDTCPKNNGNNFCGHGNRSGPNAGNFFPPPHYKRGYIYIPSLHATFSLY